MRKNVCSGAFVDDGAKCEHVDCGIASQVNYAKFAKTASRSGVNYAHLSIIQLARGFVHLK